MLNKTLCITGYLFLIILLILTDISEYTVLKNDEKKSISSSIDMVNQRMTSLFFEINNFPRSAGNDVRFLSKLTGIQNIIRTKSNTLKKTNAEVLKKDFLSFLKENTAYYQLRYIDARGNEVVKVDFDGTFYGSTANEDLQNKKDKYYFKQTINLSDGEVFISPLDLNMENGKIENRGTPKSPIYVPVMRYATPVVRKDGKSSGIIIANVYADYFLEDIRRSQREGEITFLINQDGYYLAHPNRNKEFGFMPGVSSVQNNFFNDYPKISKRDLSDLDERMIETGSKIFSLRYVYPTISSFAIHQGAEKILGEKPEKKYYWVIISVSNKDAMGGDAGVFKNDFLFMFLFAGIVILVFLFILKKIIGK